MDWAVGRALRLGLACMVVMTVSRGGEAQTPPPATPLPPLEVTAKKATPAKKKAAGKAKRAKAPVAVQSAPGPAGETATGPVDGFVAGQSATGTKTDTPILETPRTVNVIPRDQLVAQQPQTISEALRYVPGVTLEKFTAAGVFDIFVVRGFEAPLYLDGLLVPAETTLTFARNVVDPYQLERLEVLKGPASGLYGQAPPGGLVSGVSKRPTFEPHHEVFFQAGSFDRLQAGFDFSGPLDDAGKFAYRVVGLGRDTDLQMDFTDAQRYFIAPSLTWRPNSDTTITFLANAAKNSGYGPQHYVPYELTQSSAPFGRIPYSRFLGEPTDHYEASQMSIGYALEHRVNEALQFQQNLRYSYAEGTFLAIRGEGFFEVPVTHEPMVARSLNYVDGFSSNFAVDNQLQANIITGPIAHKVLFGVDYQTGHGFADYRFAFTNSINPYNPVYGLPQPPISALAPVVASTSDVSQTGVYLQDQMKLDRWIVTLGGRHDWADATTTDPLPGRAARVDIADQAWTGFAGLSYVFDLGLAPYVNYSTSFEPAKGFTLVDSSGNVLEPTTGEGFEAGVKYRPPGSRTLLTAAWFQITQENIAKPSANFAVVEQAGEVRVKGYEVELRSAVTPSLDLIAGYSHISAILTADTNPAIVGNVFPNVASDNASLWAMYTWRHGPLAGLGLGAGVRYTGPQYGNDTNTLKLDGYTLADLTVRYDFEYLAPALEGLSLQVNVTNLFDTYYVATCVTGLAYCGLGAERTLLTTLAYKW